MEVITNNISKTDYQHEIALFSDRWLERRIFKDNLAHSGEKNPEISNKQKSRFQTLCWTTECWFVKNTALVMWSCQTASVGLVVTVSSGEASCVD